MPPTREHRIGRVAVVWGVWHDGVTDMALYIDHDLCVTMTAPMSPREALRECRIVMDMNEAQQKGDSPEAGGR